MSPLSRTVRTHEGPLFHRNLVLERCIYCMPGRFCQHEPDDDTSEVSQVAMKERRNKRQGLRMWLERLRRSEKAEAATRRINLTPLLVQSNGADMNTLKGLLESGVLKPHLSAVFPFEKLADATR